MSETLTLSNWAYSVGIVICLLISAVLWRYSGKQNKQNKMLSLYFFTTCLGNFIVFLVYTRMVKDFPWFHLFRTGNVIALMIMPISFFYFRYLLKDKGFRVIDMVHFIPALCYAIDYLPIFLLPTAEKIEMATREMQMPDRGQSLQNGWITPHINWVIVRTIQMTIYWLLQLLMIYRTSKIKQFRILLKENRPIIRWLIITCLLQSFNFLPFFLNFFMGANPYNFIIIHTSLSVSVFLQIVLLFFNPEILYGLKGVIITYPRSSADKETENNVLANQIPEKINDIENISIPLPQNTQNSSTEKKDAPATEDKISDKAELSYPNKSSIPNTKLPEYLSEEKIKEIVQKMNMILLDNHAYLRKGYSMRDLSIATGYQPYLLSAVINHEYKQHFNDYINKQRIKHACNLIKSGAGKLLTLQALSEDCGFNNRNSFTTAFKKHMGQTPSSFASKIDHIKS